MLVIKLLVLCRLTVFPVFQLSRMTMVMVVKMLILSWLLLAAAATQYLS